jgi:hypothetical protein
MIKPIHLIGTLFIGVIIGIFLCSYYSKATDPHDKVIENLWGKVKWHEFKIARFQDTLKIKDQVIKFHEQKTKRAEQIASVYKKRWLDLPIQIHGETRKDSIVYLEASNLVCDSLVMKQDTLIASLKSELKYTNEYLVVLDSGFNNSQQENIDLKKIDSLHVVQLKQCGTMNKKKSLAGKVLGFVVGFVAGKIF